jgi:inosine-uridine nucleoside N-ribohydrolase
MYDPMTVVALLRPELFVWRTGRVTVELRDEKLYGLTRFTPDEAGPHRVAFGVDAAAAKKFMLDRLLHE